MTLKILNLGCALPHNHIEKYTGRRKTGWTYQICEIDIWDNHIQQDKNVSMEYLEDEYKRKDNSISARKAYTSKSLLITVVMSLVIQLLRFYHIVHKNL